MKYAPATETATAMRIPSFFKEIRAFDGSGMHEDRR
jgi:hypothetical protein